MSLGIQAWILARSLAGVLTRFWTRFLARLLARVLPQFLARLLARRLARLWRRLCGRIDIASRRRGLVFHIGRRRPGFDGPGFRRGRLTWRRVNELAGSFRLDLADRFFEREAFTGDVGFVKRRRDAAQLRNQGSARALVERTAVLAAVLLQAGDGAGNERVIIGHRK